MSDAINTRGTGGKGVNADETDRLIASDKGAMLCSSSPTALA